MFPYPAGETGLGAPHSLSQGTVEATQGRDTPPCGEYPFLDREGFFFSRVRQSYVEGTILAFKGGVRMKLGHDKDGMHVTVPCMLAMCCGTVQESVPSLCLVSGLHVEHKMKEGSRSLELYDNL